MQADGTWTEVDRSDELDLEKRALLVMFEIDELSCEEIAAVVGVPHEIEHGHILPMISRQLPPRSLSSLPDGGHLDNPSTTRTLWEYPDGPGGGAGGP